MATNMSSNSIKVIARVAGALYLIIAVAGGFAFTAASTDLVLPGDATATANSILASELLFRLGFVGDSIVFVGEIVLIVLLYVLFRPVSKIVAIIAAMFRLAMTVMQGTNLLNHVTVLLILRNTDYLDAFAPAQLHALVLLLFNMHETGALIWGIFFGFHLLVLGYLIFQSGYYPKILGILFFFAGFGYLIDSYGNLLFPAYEQIYTVVVWATVPAEMAFALWLLIKGVNVAQWEKQALEAG